MKTVVAIIDRFTEKTGQAVSYLSLILVILIGIDVVLRYALNWTSSANQELEWHLFAVLFLLGSAYTLKHDKHVRVDLFYSRFSAKNKAWVNFFGTLIFLVPFCLVVFYTSLSFVADAWHVQESSPEPGGLPHRFLVKATIPIGAGLLLLQGISILCSSFSILISKPTQ
ncbi:TRAP transporter small permease subunit [Reichenbachiella agarivorans]|uniref:TRAP transporter small permease subunit n=1 Tax=Reichenbachiella agarivorans TaxID=2979464 RepID=A0ABY6CUD4_9BACT|nr:TRAP transporter small permease subunit [Reichenbachiella agarivorans]UXP34137.1 TRAP transporter small permease subunit [Reichenbachiella agarivorans]